MKTQKQLIRDHYNRFYRDPEAAKFYKSARWRKLRDFKLSVDPICESCRQAGITSVAVMVHHMIPVSQRTRNLEMDFLVSLCHACHNAIESEVDRDRGR